MEKNLENTTIDCKRKAETLQLSGEFSRSNRSINLLQFLGIYQLICSTFLLLNKSDAHAT
jgi:hypothetical protein